MGGRGGGGGSEDGSEEGSEEGPGCETPHCRHTLYDTAASIQSSPAFWGEVKTSFQEKQGLKCSVRNACHI